MKKFIIALFLLFTVLPTVTEAKKLIPMGDPIGIRLQLDELMLAKDVQLADGKWVQAGSTLTKINGETISTINEVKAAKKTTNELQFSFEGKKLTVQLPATDVDKVLVQLMDHAEGVGTLTYLDPKNNSYGALGHQIIDQVSKEPPNFIEGSIYRVKISDVKKSKPGIPGFKVALFESQQEAGNVQKNLVYGVFGKWHRSDTESLHTPIEIMHRNEVEIGEAEILTATEGDKVMNYKIKIDKVEENTLEFTVIDTKLISITGGIVQGMSGSPIIQKNKFVGAITHMYVDKPTKGVGILMLEMLEKR
jgi:stage IV sporulation protein B